MPDEPLSTIALAVPVCASAQAIVAATRTLVRPLQRPLQPSASARHRRLVP